MRTVVKIALGIILAGVVLIGGCAVLFGAFVSGVDKEIQKDERRQERRAVTRDQVAQVKRGMSRREVIAVLGKPESTQEDHDELGRTDYLYYDVKGGEALESWQLVFEKGKLRSKSRS